VSRGAADRGVRLDCSVCHSRVVRAFCGHRWTIVVGGAASDVMVILLGQVRWIGAPIVAISRLEIQVVVDGNGRLVGTGGQTCVGNRVATSLEKFHLVGIERSGSERVNCTFSAAAACQRHAQGRPTRSEC
jgi:hypothetical protein